MLLRGDTVSNIGLVVDGPPMLIESAAGADQEFLLVAPLPGHGLAVCSRTDTNWSSSWKGPSQYDLDDRQVESGSLIWSGFPAPEMVFRQGEELFFTARNLLLRWDGPHSIMLEPEPGIRSVRKRLTGASGDPSFIQEGPSDDSSDDFLVLTPTTSGDLALYRRDNRIIQFPWTGPELLDLAEPIESVAIAEGLGQDTLEVVGRSGRRLVHLRRDNAGQWTAPSPILVEGQPALGASGAIAMIRSSIERAQNLEFMVPLETGGIAHYWRDENDPLKNWHAGAVLGEDEGKFRAVAVVQSRAGPRSELVVVALTGTSLVIFAGSGDDWKGPIPLVCGNRGVRLPDLESPP